MFTKKKIFILMVAVLAAAALITVLVILFTPHEHTVKGTYSFYNVGESYRSELPEGDLAEEHFDKIDIELDINSEGNFFYTNIDGNMNCLGGNLSLSNIMEGNTNKDRIMIKPMAPTSDNGHMFYLSSDYKGACFILGGQNKFYAAVFEDEQPTVGEIVKMFERCFP